MRSLYQLIATAFRTLTVFPLPGKTVSSFASSVPYYPIVGFTLSAIPFAVVNIASYAASLPNSIVALLALILTMAATGFLHQDGFSDSADAFGAGRDKETILRILKDVHLGTFGTVALIFDIVLKWQLWEVLIRRDRLVFIMLSLVVSRFAMAILPLILSPAKTTGLGATLDEKSWVSPLILSFFGVVLIGCLILVSDYTFALTLIIPALAVSLAWAFFLWKSIGGFTGDTLGALNEMVEITVLLTLCAAPYPFV